MNVPMTIPFWSEWEKKWNELIERIFKKMEIITSNVFFFHRAFCRIDSFSNAGKLWKI